MFHTDVDIDSYDDDLKLKLGHITELLPWFAWELELEVHVQYKMVILWLCLYYFEYLNQNNLSVLVFEES